MTLQQELLDACILLSCLSVLIHRVRLPDVAYESNKEKTSKQAKKIRKRPCVLHFIEMSYANAIATARLSKLADRREVLCIPQVL